MPTEFFGRKLKEAQKRYFSVKMELLAIYESVIHFKNILWGRPFTILTDSKALTQHIQLQNQSDISMRWIEKLQEFSYKIEHIEGKLNSADYISRHINTFQDNYVLQIETFKINKDLSEENIKAEQYKDPKLNKIIQQIKNNKNTKNTKKFQLN